MSNSLKKRILLSLLTFVFGVMCLGIMEKFLGNDDWIIGTIVVATFLSIGYFIAKTYEGKNRSERFSDEFTIAGLMLLPIVFIAYVVIEISLINIIRYVITPLILSLLLNTEWKN